MNPEQVAIVQRSFDRAMAEPARTAALFYDRVFAMAPDVRSMFGGDMAAQGVKLVATLELVVSALDRIEPLLPLLDELARRHRGCGVVDRHYYVVGEALVWTLERAIGSAWTGDHREAWLEAWGLLSGRMIEASRTDIAR